MSTKNQLNPIDIELQQRTPLEGGALFVVLRTLDELELFWEANREKYPYAAQGHAYGEKQHFLNEYEWVFGPTKTAVVKAVFRWSQIGIVCKWHDWAAKYPAEHASWFLERDKHREKCLATASWTDADEAAYQSDCLKRSPDSYRGWWKLENLPANMDYSDWFSPWVEEIIDPELPAGIVMEMLQEQTFDDWKSTDAGEVEFHDVVSLDKDIAYWQAEKQNGQSYYGDENEAQSQT